MGVQFLRNDQKDRGTGNIHDKEDEPYQKGIGVPIGLRMNKNSRLITEVYEYSDLIDKENTHLIVGYELGEDDEI